MPVLSTLGAAIANVYGFTSGLIKDQYFNLVSLLLPGNGTNGATNNSFVDSSTANSGTGWPITRNGDTTQGTFSPFSQTGWGVYFPGSTSTWINAPDNAVLELGSNDFTIECWVYATSSFSALRTFTSKYNHFVLSINTTPALSFNWYGSSSSSSIGTLVDTSINKWHHFAVCRSGSTLYMFQNGQQLSLTNSTITGTLNNDATGPMIGGNSNQSGGSIISANDPWIGYISNYRLTNGAALYTSGFTPSTSPLTTTSQGASASQVEWLTCQSNRFKDNSNNDFSLTVTGSPSVTPFSPFAPTSSYSAAAVGGSGYFDGSGDYLNTASDAAFTLGSSGDFTIEGWIYANGNQPTGSGGIVATTASDWSSGFANTWTLRIVSTTLGWLNDSGSNSITATITPNQWFHVAVVRSASTITMYVNGSSAGTQTTSQAYTTQGSVKIGYVSGAAYFSGYVSNFRVVKGTAVYTAAFTPPTAPLTAITNTSLLLNFTNAGVVDATAKNVLETEGNAQISTAQSKWGGGSIAFDGTGDWLIFPSSNAFAFGTGDYTVETWVYFTSINTTDLQIIFMSGSTSGNNFYFHVDGNQISVGTSAAFISNQVSSFSTGVWYHIAACRAGGTLRLFKDGVQQGTNATDSTNWTSEGFARIGSNQSSSQTLYGYVDDFRISKFARYTGNFTAPTAPFPLQ